MFSSTSLGFESYTFGIYPDVGCRVGFPGGAVVKNLPANAGDTRDMNLIPGLGRSFEVGNGNLLQYSCLENSMGRGASWATVYVVAKSWTLLSTHTAHTPKGCSRNSDMSIALPTLLLV